MDTSDWQERVAQLPLGHAVALRLHAAGQDDEVIATALGVPVESVTTLLEIARVKLEHVPTPPPGEGRQNQWSITEAATDPDL